MVTDLHLKGNELLLYAIIYGFTQAEDQKYSGSQQYLADWLGSPRKTVRRNIDSLIEKGLLGKEEVTLNGVKYCNYYTILNDTTRYSTIPNDTEGHSDPGWVKMTQGVGQNDPGGWVKMTHHNKDTYTRTNNERETNKEKDFDRWWSAYPRKVNKQGAEKAFMKVDADIETMMAVLEKQKRSDQWTRDDGQFIPHPTTYLNQRRWEDEITESKPTMNLLMRGLKRE